MSDNADMNATVAQVDSQLPAAGVEEVKPQVVPQTPDASQATPEGADPAWLPERLKRAEQQAVKRMLDELGVTSQDDLKAVVAERKAAEDAQLSEIEKATKRAAELEEQLTAERAERSRIEREVGFRDAWTAAGRPLENLAAALKLVDWPEGEADFPELVKATVTAYPVLDPEPPKPDTGSAVGRRAAPAGPNPNFERWSSMTRVPAGGDY